MSREIPSEWSPMMREGGIAAESLYSGLTSLRKANYAESSRYNHAFFGITIGLERLSKLVILLDSRETEGGYPAESEFRNKYGHNLKKLFGRVEEIRLRFPNLKWNLADRSVAISALEILADFAGKTRYYNLDILVGAKGAAERRDPIEAWYTDIGGWALKNRYNDARRLADEAYARAVSGTLERSSVVSHRGEDGTAIISVYEGALRTRQAEIIQREGTFICVCLARYIAEPLTDLVYACWRAGAHDVPALHEYFGMLNNRDQYLRRRRTFAAD